MISLSDIQWVDSLTHKNNQYEEIEKSLETINRRSASAEKDVRRLKENIAKLEPVKDQWESFDVELIKDFPDHIRNSLKAHIRYKKRSVGSDYQSITRQLGRVEEALNRYCAEKVQYQLKLAQHNKNENIIDAETINNTILKDHPYLSRFRMFTKNGRLHYMFVASGIKAQVDDNQFPLLNGGGPVEIPIPPCIVIVSSDSTLYVLHPLYLKSYNIDFWETIKDEALEKALNEPTQNYYTRNSVHPHILDGQRACLGSFGTPLAEAIADGDIITVFSVAQMFLGSINSDDPAGRKYIKYQNDNAIPVNRCVESGLGRVEVHCKIPTEENFIIRGYAFNVGREVKIFNGEIIYGEYTLRVKNNAVPLANFYNALKEAYAEEGCTFLEADFREYEDTQAEVIEALEEYFKQYDIEMSVTEYEEPDDDDEDRDDDDY